MKRDEIVRDVATAVALIEGAAGVLEVVNAVARLEPIAVRKISRTVGLPVPIVAAICAELRKREVVAVERPVQLTPEGRAAFGFAGRTPVTDPEVGLPADLEDVTAELTKVAEAAPRVRLEIDQSHCTVETKIRRVLLLHGAGALSGKRVLFLGDDDLMSVALDRVARHYGFAGTIREVAVVDIDPEVVAFCRSRLHDAIFPAAFHEHDLRAPLPDAVAARFDTVLIDPPYTPEGAELFLSRAASALSRVSGSNVFFCFGMKPPPDALRIQSAIAEMGFVIRRLERNFNEYTGAGALGGVSNLYHLTSTNTTGPLIDEHYAGLLYTGDERGTRRYRCVSCGAVETVGRHQVWETIGDLKAHRCPRCRAGMFRPMPRSGGPVRAR